MPVQHFADPKWKGRHDKGLRSRFLMRVHQASPEKAVHRSLEGVSGAPLLLLHQHGNIVVNGQSGSHIMMLRD
jgi:hypothetical protein